MEGGLFLKTFQTTFTSQRCYFTNLTADGVLGGAFYMEDPFGGGGATGLDIGSTLEDIHAY